MLNTPFPPWPSFTEEEADAVRRVLLSNRVNYWTGTEAREFEREFAQEIGVRHAVALSNGTVALEGALRAVGVGPGDKVVVTSRSFIASASCAVSVGAVPVFADVDPDSGNLTAETIRAALRPGCKAVVCVHLAGWPCEMDPILELARERGLFVVEDCAQANGARYKGRPVGSLGHIAAWSFCQDKIVTTAGEGGMVTTNDRELWSKVWSFKDHGKSWEAMVERKHPPGSGFKWVHDSFGTNGRMTEVQAAVGRIQLRRLPEWHAARLANARAIWEAARGLPGLRVPIPPSHVEHAAYKCYVYVEPGALRSGWDRDRIMAEIEAGGVPCYSGSCSEAYLERAFEGTGWRPAERLPVARALGETSLMFLVHPTLRAEDVARTCEVLARVMREAAG